MKEKDHYHIATAAIKPVVPHETLDVHAFYKACIEETANRQRPIDWKRMVPRRIGEWVSAQVLYQMIRQEPIPHHVTGEVDPILQPTPFNRRIATWIADASPDTRVWPEAEDDEEVRYLSKFALNPRLMGHRIMPLIAARMSQDLAAQGVRLVRFDHIPELNDHYEQVFPDSQNMGGRLFPGFERQVYVVRRQIAIAEG